MREERIGSGGAGQGGDPHANVRAMSKDRGSFLAALLIAVALCGAPLFSHGLWSPDEPLGAGVGRTMADSGDWIVPRLNGQPFLEKPPLYWWTLAAGLRLLGDTDVAARAPSALFAVLTLLAVWAAGRRLGGARPGARAGAAPLSAWATARWCASSTPTPARATATPSRSGSTWRSRFPGFSPGLWRCRRWRAPPPSAAGRRGATAAASSSPRRRSAC